MSGSKSDGEEVIGDLGCQDGSVCGKSGNGGIEVMFMLMLPLHRQPLPILVILEFL